MRALATVIGLVMAWYVRLVAATCRIQGGPTSQAQVVLAFWHEYNLVAAVAAWRLRRHRYHVSFSTQAFRGQIMTAMLARLGTGSVALPGEEERGENARLSMELARLGREGASPAVSPDGPVGPYRLAKPGALIVARESGLPIQPWAVVARPAVRLGRRWDRHMLPLPFCRLRVIEGRQLAIGPRDRLRPKLAELQAELERVASVADRRATAIRKA
jgi:lysophospholipid acyltransferase (LPLAT)-like uncharacterized protein